jgi:hypothetical protein
MSAEQQTNTWTPEWLIRTSPAAAVAMSEHRQRVAQTAGPASTTAHEEIR